MKYTLICLLALVAFSCKKKEDRSCWKGWGEDIVKTITLEKFEGLFVTERIEVTLVEDTLNYVILRGGSNMLNNIEAYVDEENFLQLHNKNKCYFLRGYKRKIKAEIHFTELYNINCESSESFTSLNTLNINYLTLLIRDGGGNVNLKLNSKQVNATVAHGYGDFVLSGVTENLYVALGGYGFCNTQNLQVSDSLTFSLNSAGAAKLNIANAKVKGKLISTGDAYLKGQPLSIEIENRGDAEVIYE